MAFTQQNLNYAAEYSRALANAYPYLSYFSEIWGAPNAQMCKPGIGKTMYIPSLTTAGARAAGRDQITGTFNRNWNNSLQPVTLDMDREWDTLVDPMDMDETNMVATIANVTRTFTEQQKVPEMDAYMASKLYGFVSPDTVNLTTNNILTKWDSFMEQLTNARVNKDRVVGYVTPALFNIIKGAVGLTRYLDIGANGGEPNRISREIARLDGVPLHVVPTDMMKTAYDFSEGWRVADSAKQINLILVDLDAVAAPVKYETSMLSEPTAQSKGKYLYYERYYYGVFKLSGRNGIVVNAQA